LILRILHTCFPFLQIRQLFADFLDVRILGDCPQLEQKLGIGKKKEPIVQVSPIE
jgi:hypothetical protein